ncbi:PE-PGRS family protein [Dyadobacter sp. CY107]|uniref:PE-PGRS family protein n=1 Tax=Dyadobacter fanqingshengii TaxID=2906443 RepID=UPI001F2EE49A|nr:PE-PGRS family protein [Dyadobacter fanqingshengii]MCF2503348.1 PE-PGRS family protein [Dyadobacter fanqingshengii]
MKLYKRLSGQIGVVLSSIIFCVTCACDPPPKPDETPTADFETTPQKVAITPGIVDEASGIVASYNMPGNFWVNQDSGQPNSLYLLSVDGKNIREMNIPGSANRDWEDVAAGPGPNAGVNYLYIGDIGNNNEPKSQVGVIFRIPEVANANAGFDGSKLEKITFSYPDGPRDAESLMLDPASKDLFIISKEGQNTGIYRLAFPQSTTETIVAEKMGTVPGVGLVTGGNISKDGSEILIRTYLAVYYWKVKTGESIGQTLTQPSTKQLLVALEPQGEAVCMDADGNGFYTISERSSAASVTLNFYKRK